MHGRNGQSSNSVLKVLNFYYDSIRIIWLEITDLFIDDAVYLDCGITDYFLLLLLVTCAYFHISYRFCPVQHKSCHMANLLPNSRINGTYCYITPLVLYGYSVQGCFGVSVNVWYYSIFGYSVNARRHEHQIPLVYPTFKLRILLVKYALRRLEGVTESLSSTSNACGVTHSW